MFTRKGTDDNFDKILNTEDIQLKTILIKKQIDFFKSQKPNFEYDYKNYLILIESFHKSKNYEYNIIWLQTINEIIRLNPDLKKKYFKITMKIVFSHLNEDETDYNDYYKKEKDKINKIRINSIDLFTNRCEDIFSVDNYFHTFNHLKELLLLLIIDIFPNHYSKENNKVLLLISNIFLNINKNKRSKNFLKNNFFSILFNLFIEMLCYLCLYKSFKVIGVKKSSCSSMKEFDNNSENEDDKKMGLNKIEETKNKHLDFINKSKKMFDLYLSLGEKNNFDIIINYQILLKIFIIQCIESQYNKSNCIEWFKEFYNNFKLNKILKIISDILDDEIFDVFKVNENLSDEKNGKKEKKLINPKLKFVNIFFYLEEINAKEINLNNSIYNFINRFNKLRKKLIENKEYIYNGLIILINLLFTEISSKKESKINFQEELVIITLLKCVMKYMTKINVLEMQEVNKNYIDNLLNLIIEIYGPSLNEKIWKELMVGIKYFYSELNKKDEKYAITKLSALLKKMISLKINGIYQFDEKLFYDLLNKVCESKSNNYIIDDYILFSVYFKNKFKSDKSFQNNISFISKYFINLIKENYNLLEIETSFNEFEVIVKRKNEFNLISGKVLALFINYILIYFNVYSKYRNKNIELFLYDNFKYLNFYFSLQKNLQSKYINLVINILNNTTDLDYFQGIISYIISLHSSEIQILKNKELLEKYLHLFEKIIIKLINKLSISSQVCKLNYLFESIYNRLNATINDDINYNFLKNILEVYTHLNITKYGEILIKNKIATKNKTNDIISKYYFSIGKKEYTCILLNDIKNLPKKAYEEWCFINIKQFFSILIEILKKKNIKIEFKEKILNFIELKINDIFFFSKINIEKFIDYVIQLDKNNLKEFIIYSERKEPLLSINNILKNISHFLLYNKSLFYVKNNEETYEKIINYAFDKINYFQRIIRLIINKYNIKIIKNKNSKHFLFMKNLLGIDKENMPNILNLKIDQTDFKFSTKEREKDINFQIFKDEDIKLDEFVYPKNNLKEILNYLKSYFYILEISLNSLEYIHSKNKNMNMNNNINFIKQLERNLNIYFDNNVINDSSEKIEYFNKNNETIPEKIKNKYENICERLFGIFNKFPSIIKYQNNFLYDIYKLFLYCKDFILLCGENYIIKSILILFNISFQEFYQKFFENINNDFKFKCNNGKDFLFQKIESIKINENLSTPKNDSNNNIINMNRKESVQNLQSNSFLENNIKSKRYEKSNSESFISNSNKLYYNGFVSKSVINLKPENDYKDEEHSEKKSSENNFLFGLNSDKNINENQELIESKNEKIRNKIFLIRRILIEFIISSKYSLKIFHIINNIVKENDKNKEEGIILFLLYCKWKIISQQNINRNEGINIFKNKNKTKNYFNQDVYNISIENVNQKKTVAIKSPISSFNYIINNNYKNIQGKDAFKILKKSLIQEKDSEKMEEILSQKLKGKMDSTVKNYNKHSLNNIQYKSTNTLNEIKELEDEYNNLSNSDDKNNKSLKEDENDFLNDDLNNPNLEELISVMHGKTKNNLFKTYENEFPLFSNKFNSIDKNLVYNEMTIYISYIINSLNKSSLFNIYDSLFMKFLKKLTKKENVNNIPYNQIKLNEQKEFIFSDNFNITKYILNSVGKTSDIINSHIYLIYNDSLQNNLKKPESFIRNNLDLFNEYIYLYIFIIPVSDEFWKIEFRLNQKKDDEFSKKLQNMIEKNFLKCYYFSIKNNFGYIIYHLKILFSLLQDLICNVKNCITDKKLKNKLNGIKHEEMIERMHLFKSINL